MTRIQKYNVIGIMSGTSLDGIDIAHITFTKQKNKWLYKLGECQTIKYNPEWRETLKELHLKTKEKIEIADKNYAYLIAETTNSFIKKNQLKIDFICSHGHTVLHQPRKKLTLQIGNGNIISKQCGISVINDFRSLDVKLGGQGAPLVPIGDKLLFSEYKYCVNLGGFSNISFEYKKNRIAFDICPTNIVLNQYASELGYEYDENGKNARDGIINSLLLEELNRIDYYSRKGPKSLGIEWVNKKFTPIINKYNECPKNVLKTCVEHFAFQIGKHLKNNQCLLTGGGAFNQFLVERIKHHSKAKIVVPNIKLVEFKEALIFGFLGVLKLNNQVNCLKSVTGASKDSVGGQIIHI